MMLMTAGQVPHGQPAMHVNAERKSGHSWQTKLQQVGRKSVPPRTVAGCWSRQSLGPPARTWCQADFKADPVSACKTDASCDLFLSRQPICGGLDFW